MRPGIAAGEPIGRRGLLAAAAAVAAAACTGRGASDAPVGPRVVSVSPSATEAVFAIGRGDRLVGRSRFCDEPPEVAALPEIGGFADPSLERIVALAPTLVVGERGPAGPRLAAALETQGIATYFPPITTIAEIEASLRGLGERLDAAPGAEAAIGRIREALGEVDAIVAGRARRRALLLFDFDPIVAAGPGCFPDELLRRAGADNVVTGGGMYPRLGAEAILALDPELVLDGSAPPAGAPPLATILREKAGLAELRAVREGRVARLEGTAALRPGPRIGEGVRQLARIVGGGAP